MSDKYKIDLSDGFGTEDIGGIFYLFYRFIRFIFVVILYPYVWIWRMTSRALAFVRIKDQKETPLNDVQIRFMESLPMYFILTGFFVGILMAILVFINDASELTAFLDELSIDAIIQLIYDILAFILEVILWIVGLDTTVDGVKTERFGIMDIFRVIFIEFLFTMFTEDPVLTFLGAGAIGLVLVIVYIILSETETVVKLFGSLKNILITLFLSPRRLYNRLDSFFSSLNKYLANIIIGRGRLEERNIGFHKKITGIVFAFGLYTFISGIVVLLTAENLDPVEKMSFFVIVLLGFGLGVGIIGLWIVVRILDKISKKSGKYKEIASK